MTSLALRDHASQILQAIALDIEESQTELAQAYKSKGYVRIAEATRTAAQTHGALRISPGSTCASSRRSSARCGRACCTCG